MATNQNQSAVAFTLTIPAPISVPSTVQFATIDGTAKGGTDSTAMMGSATIAANTTSVTVSVPILNHAITGNSINFTLALYNPSNLTLSATTATGTITGSGPNACAVPTIQWTGAAAGGHWSTAGNWSPARIPQASDIVCIGTGTAVLDQPATVAAIGTAASTSFTINSTLSLASTTQNSQFGANVLLNGSPQGEIDVAGTLELTAGTLTWGEPGQTAINMSGVSKIGGAGTVIVHSGASVALFAGDCNQRFGVGGSYQGGCAYLTPTLRNDGSFTIASGLLFRDSATPITNNGSLTLGDPNPSDGNDAAAIRGGCLDLNGNPGENCGIFSLINNGTIAKPAGTHASSLTRLTVANTSTVHIGSGTVVFDADFPTQPDTQTLTGSYVVDAAGTLETDGSTLLAASASLTGQGALALSGNSSTQNELAGTDALPGLTTEQVTTKLDHDLALTSMSVGGPLDGTGSITLNAPTAGTSTNILNGDLSDSVGLTVNSPVNLTWGAGIMGGTGTTTIQSGATLSLNQAFATWGMAGGRTLVNNGLVDWTNGSLQANGGTVINNGTFRVSWSLPNNSPTFGDSTGNLRFVNNGLLQKNGTGAADIDGIADGGGVLSVTGGVLQLRVAPGVSASLGGGGTVATGATLDVSGPNTGSLGSLTLPTDGTLSGGGTLSIQGLGGSDLVTEIDGSDLLPGLVVGHTASASQQLILNTDLSLTSMNLSAGSGTLAGTGNITLAGTGNVGYNLAGSGNFNVTSGSTLNWTGGSWAGSGSTVIALGASLNLNPVAVAYSFGGTRSLINNGTFTDGTGSSVAATSGTITNNGAWNMIDNNAFNPPQIRDGSTGTFTFNNAGTITATSTAGPSATAEIGGYVSSAGGLNVGSGTLVLRPAVGVAARLVGTPNATIASGATLTLGGTTSPRTPAGSFVLPAGTSISGQGSLVIGEGSATSPPFKIAGSVSVGTYSSSFDSNLTLVLGGATNFGKIVTTGQSTLAGSLTIVESGGYVPAVGTQFQIVAAGTLAGSVSTIAGPTGQMFTVTNTTSTATLKRTP